MPNEKAGAIRIAPARRRGLAAYCGGMPGGRGSAESN